MSIPFDIVFSEMVKKRKYDMKKRAELQRETRRRIVDATVELHRIQGPAHTTIKEIAQRAGVNRLTVYNHFPDIADLLRACSSRWREQDRKSTRLNSSHANISYAVFCLKKKNTSIRHYAHIP